MRLSQSTLYEDLAERVAALEEANVAKSKEKRAQSTKRQEARQRLNDLYFDDKLSVRKSVTRQPKSPADPKADEAETREERET